MQAVPFCRLDPDRWTMTGFIGGGRASGSIVVGTVAALLIVALAGALVFSTGFGPPEAGQPAREPTTAAPTPAGDDGSGDAEGSSGSGGSGGSGGAGSSGGSGGGGGSGSASNGESEAETPTPPPYDFDVVRIEDCGNTCRDVTVQLTNNRDARASGVVVTTRIYAGNETTENAEVWEGRRDVGTLGPDGSTTATERVSLSYFEALSVKQKGGWITIVTTVESEEVTRTFEERRKVA